jgi:hypothetical protein
MAGAGTIATGMPIAVTRTNSASATATSSMTAAVPGRYIGVIPSHLQICASSFGQSAAAGPTHVLRLALTNVASHD